MLDDAQDKIDKQVKGWEAIEDHINHNVSLIKLISGEKAYDSLVKQYDSNPTADAGNQDNALYQDNNYNYGY